MKKSTKKNQDDNTTGKKNSPHSSDTSPLNKGNSQAKGVTLPKKWDKLKVLGEIIKLAERERERERATPQKKQSHY